MDKNAYRYLHFVSMSVTRCNCLFQLEAISKYEVLVTGIRLREHQRNTGNCFDIKLFAKEY